MSSIGADALEALRDRLKTITIANGYTTGVKKVTLGASEPTLNQASMDLPIIEVFDELEEYQHDVGTSYWCNQTIILYLVNKKESTDRVMQQMMTDIRKCLFGGSATASGNSGLTLGGKVAKMELVDSRSDLNMIESCRVYLMRIRLRSHRTTFKD